jgi:hypothetical protein
MLFLKHKHKLKMMLCCLMMLTAVDAAPIFIGENDPGSCNTVANTMDSYQMVSGTLMIVGGKTWS